MTDQNNNKLYILGHPVAHSKSPAMYNALYGKLGLDWEYGFMDCSTIQEAEEFLRSGKWISVNVTTPYKPEAYEVATHKAATAELSKGVNLLVNHNGALLGYNVDGEGCIRYLLREGVKIKGRKVAVCGTGPTSVSILNAAVSAGASEVLLLGRDKDRAERIVSRYLDDYRHLLATAIDISSANDWKLGFAEAYDNANFKYGSYSTSTQAISEADVIIDATPLGMAEGDKAPFDTSLLNADQVVMDVVYGHGVTTLVSEAEKRGCRTFDGAGMLVSQAAITASIVCEIESIDLSYTYDELFEIMWDAAFA